LLIQSTREKIKNITQLTGTAFINFGVFTTGTANRGKFLILHIEDLSKSTTRGTKLVGFVIHITTFYTDIFGLIHLFYFYSLVKYNKICEYEDQ